MQQGISVLIPTYNRCSIVIETIFRLRQYLRYDGHIQVVVGIDGSDGTWECLNALRGNFAPMTILPQHGPRFFAAPDEQGKLPGLGANLNQLIHYAAFDLLLQMDDDHWLDGELDLNTHAYNLHNTPQIGWIRLMGVSAHNYHAHMIQGYWYVEWNSPEVYIPSNRPHIKRRDFHDLYGPYPTHLSVGDTEEHFGHQCKAIAASLPTERLQYVTVPVSLNEQIWRHVGQSWQGRE